MSSKFAWGYVEIDMCRRCLNPAHLFVYSGLPSENRESPKCEKCIVYEIERLVHFNNFTEEYRSSLQHDSLNPPSQQPEVFSIIVDTPTCDACETIEGTGMFRFVEAEIYTDTPDEFRTITVHARCANNCPDCERTLASPKNRHYASHWRISHEYFFTFHRCDGEDRCAPCTDKYKAETGGEGEFFWCHSCDSDWNHRYASSYRGERYCSDCVENNSFECDDCGADCWDGDDHFCEGDDDYDSGNSVIHNYSYRPSLNFFGEGKYHLGFELEVEARNTTRNEGAEVAQEVFGGRAYLKEDGSLDNGFEIVTHPHTLVEYQKAFNWDGLEKIKRQGLRSWNTSTCGLHVHVSRSAFQPVRVPNMKLEERLLKRQAHELRFMKLIYDNERQVCRIAGRSSNHYATFGDKGKLVRKVKDGYQENGRYSAINTENDATLEVRIFKGSLRRERVLSALEFVTASVEYTRNLPINGKNNALSWLAFTGYVAQHAETYPNLALIMNESFRNDYAPSED